MQYTEIFSAVKMKNFIGKNDIFLIFAQNIHCGYTLIPPLVGSSKEYPQCMIWNKNKKIRCTPANPSFIFYMNLGFKGIFTARTCFPGEVIKALEQFCPNHFASHQLGITA